MVPQQKFMHTLLSGVLDCTRILFSLTTCWLSCVTNITRSDDLLAQLCYTHTHMNWPKAPLITTECTRHLHTLCMTGAEYSCYRKCHVNSDNSLQTREKLGNRVHSRQKHNTQKAPAHTASIQYDGCSQLHNTDCDTRTNFMN